MATRAELRARLSLDRSLFDAGIASAQAGARRLSAGLATIAGIGARAMMFTGTAAIGLGTGIAYGTKKAFDLGSTLKELSSRTGISAGKLLVLQRAFKDAGMEAEDIGPAVNRMQKFIQEAGDKGLKKFGLTVRELKQLKPDEQFQAIGKAIAAIKDPAERTAAVMKIFGKSGGKLLDLFGDPKAMQDAQAAVGKQAQILDKNANLFDQISDKLNHAGAKLSGFFVGVADGVSQTLAPILDKLDGIDLAGIGQKFGAGLVQGAQALVGLFANPSALFDTALAYMKAGMLGVGNVLIASFKSALDFFQTGWAATLTGIAATLTATLMESFQSPIAYLQAGIEEAVGADGGSKAALNFQIATKSKLRDSPLGTSVNPRTLKTELNSYGKGLQKDIDLLSKQRDAVPSFEDRYNRILKEGPKFGMESIGGKKDRTAAELRADAQTEINKGVSAAVAAARNFKVPDVLGAGEAMSAANANVQKAMVQGRGIIGRLSAPNLAPSPAVRQWDRFAGFGPSQLGELNKQMAGAKTPFGFGGASDRNQMSQAYKTSPYAYKTHPDAYAPGESAASTGEDGDSERLDDIKGSIDELKQSFDTAWH